MEDQSWFDAGDSPFDESPAQPQEEKADGRTPLFSKLGAMIASMATVTIFVAITAAWAGFTYRIAVIFWEAAVSVL